MRSRPCALLATLVLALLLPLPTIAARDVTGLAIKIKAPAAATVGKPFTFTVAVTNEAGEVIPIAVVTHMPQVDFMGGGTAIEIDTPGLVADGGGCGAFSGCTTYYNSYPHAPYALSRGTTRLFEDTILYNYPGTYTFRVDIYQVDGAHDSANATIPVTGRQVRMPREGVPSIPARLA